MLFKNIQIVAVCCLFSSHVIGQIDVMPPTVVCVNGLSVNGFNYSGSLQPPSVKIWATDFLQYAEDDSTDASQIIFALRDPDINPGIGFPMGQNGLPMASLDWPCTQIGANLVELWAMDKAGNTAFCTTTLFLSDQTGVCANWPNFLQKPFCATSANCQTGIADVQVFLGIVGVPTFPTPPIRTTDDTGCFMLNATALPTANSYYMNPHKDVNPHNGVSMADLSKLEQHLSGIQPFTDPFQFVAADVNNDLNVSAADLVELEKLVLGIYSDFPANDSWRFVLKNQGFGIPLWHSNWVESCEFDIVSNTACDFDGIKIGDLTGNANCAEITGEALLEYHSPVQFSIENRSLKTGQFVEIPIFSTNGEALLGWQLALKFDPSFIEIMENQPDATDLVRLPKLAKTAQDRVAMGWFSAEPRQFLDGRDALISLKINVLRDCKLADVLFLEKENLMPEAYFENETSQPISLIFSEKKEAAPAQNLTAWPNPFSEKTTLAWSQTESGEATIDVFDAMGRAVFSTKILGEKGANRFGLSGISEGLFFVKIQSGGALFTASILVN